MEAMIGFKCIYIYLCLLVYANCVQLNNHINYEIENNYATVNKARQQFHSFIEKYGKHYANDAIEKERRFLVFERNLMKIKLLNRNERGSAIYGVTQFTDLTDEEFRRHYTGFRPQLSADYDSGYEKILSERELMAMEQQIPQQYDWRSTNGVVSAVKNQGMCGSCWAFSTTGNVEGIWAINKNQSVSLSEQDLVDCDKLDEGCNGGLPTNAFKTIIQMGGIESEKDYPYDGRDEKCNFNKSLSKVSIDSYVVLPTNETILAQWLFKNGPISIGINANAMQFYFGGISHPLKWLCNPKDLDHGVLIVGYGIGKTRILKKTQPFWIIKNSWGSSWGEKGYYRVYRGDGTCGLNMMASSAWIDK